MPASLPAFGEADLSNCEREQIHLAGSIQPHGVLLRLDEPSLAVVQASANAREIFSDADLIGRSLGSIEGDIEEKIRPYLNEALDVIPVAVRCHIGKDRIAFDGLLHRPPSGGLIVELERAGPLVDLSKDVEEALHKLVAAPSLRRLADDTVAILKTLTGYDRVMVYRFDEEGHGEVYAEMREPHLEAFIGNRYPASDIPQIARQLYERNRIRVLVDVDYDPVPIRPACGPEDDQKLDMSLCFLRSMSPLHIQYLKNMGVGATLVISLMAGGRLWGLIACHHYAPRFVHYELRSVCEVLAEAIGVRIAALESVQRNQIELSIRRLEQRVIEIIAQEGDWRAALFDSSNLLLTPLSATGAAMVFEGQIMTTGDVPGTHDIREISSWLDRRPRAPVIATKSLGQDHPDFEHLKRVAAGVIATPLSRSAGDYLIWFRPERIQTITWGGNPFKPVEIGNDPADLSPRRSFSQWHQQVEGTSDSWTEADLAAARLVGDAIADFALQFRSVRMLIAKTQLEQVSTEVAHAEQPLLILDRKGQAILTNAAFDQLLGRDTPLTTMEELPRRFEPTDQLQTCIEGLRQGRTSWQGEVRLNDVGVESRTFLLRIEAVHAAPDSNSLMGYVLLFGDLTEQRLAERARRDFQEEVIAHHRMPPAPLNSKDDLLYRNILTSVIGNAQLAALEVADSMDVTRMPQMLESISQSVDRTAGLLEHLIVHAAKGNGDR
jgi:light-regulated signal transduction histidine kinase (bacteriophytochrome)